MINLPCKECICLPTCKATYNTRATTPNEFVNPKALALNMLFNKCSILDSYITIDTEPNFKRINKLHKFFG